jgi:hypothetical protein
MAVYQALLLNTVVPQIQAAQAGDSYVMVVNATTPALRITQTGTGNALEVEDSANPDATPFVVTAAGDVGVGTTSPISKLDIRNTGGTYDKGISIQTVSAGNIGTIWTSTTDLNIGIAGAHKFTNFDGSSTKMTLDASGNLGLGVAPSAWAAGIKAIEIYSKGNAFVSSAASQSLITTNAYFDSAWKYGSSAAASYYSQASGVHSWYTAASGTANTAITSFTQAMTLDASGNLGIATTSPVAPLTINKNSGDGIFVRSADTNYSSLGFGISTSSGYTYIQSTNSGSGTVQPLAIFVGNTERARITSGGNLNFGNSSADRATTAGTAVINIFNGTAPVGTLANGISLYSSSGEAYVMDAAGNATLFSPHDSETNEWIFKSKHTPSGKVLKIDVEKMLRFINDHFGLDAIHEFTEE